MSKRYPEDVDGAVSWESGGAVLTFIQNKKPPSPPEAKAAMDAFKASLQNMLDMAGVPGDLMKEQEQWYCGYVRFKKRFLKEEGYRGIVTYVPVHGGITYANEDEDDGSMVYGFDCNHSGDADRPYLQKETWIRNECEKLAVCLRVAADYENEYLAADTNEEKSEILDRYKDDLERRGWVKNAMNDMTSNFGVMLNLLSGDL